MKYKRLPAGGYLNADLYQLLAYAIALDLPGGTLIYAADEGIRAGEHVVVHAGKRLQVVALRLAAPPATILAQIRAIAERIKPATPHAGAVSSFRPQVQDESTKRGAGDMSATAA